jgi:hypothetical protein
MAKKLRVVKAPTNNRELIALDVLARDPATGEIYIKRIPAGNPRDVGRKRMERGFHDAFETMRISGALKPGYVRDSQMFNMRLHLDEIASIVDEAIADDDEAGLLMRTIGYALDSMYGLGGIDRSFEPERRLAEKAAAGKLGTQRGVATNKEKATSWHAIIKPVWWEKRGKFPKSERRRRCLSQRRLAERIAADFEDKVDQLPGADQIEWTFKQWEKTA